MKPPSATDALSSTQPRTSKGAVEVGRHRATKAPLSCETTGEEEKSVLVYPLMVNPAEIPVGRTVGTALIDEAKLASTDRSSPTAHTWIHRWSPSCQVTR